MAEPTNAQNNPTCMESVNRLAKIPVVESTIQTGIDIYGKVKDFNSVTQWTMSTAENTVNKAVEVGKPYAAPVVKSLEGPIKKVDDILCSGLDYVEAKVPAVKLPPNEIYNSTKDIITNNSTVQTAYSMVQPAVETAKNTVQGAKSMVEPAIESAKHLVEPAVQGARNIVDPYVQTSLETATAIKDYGVQKVEEYLHSQPSGDHVPECSEGESDSKKAD